MPIVSRGTKAVTQASPITTVMFKLLYSNWVTWYVTSMLYEPIKLCKYGVVIVIIALANYSGVENPNGVKLKFGLLKGKLFLVMLIATEA